MRAHYTRLGLDAFARGRCRSRRLRLPNVWLAVPQKLDAFGFECRLDIGNTSKPRDRTLAPRFSMLLIMLTFTPAASASHSQG